MEFRPLFGTQANIERQKEEQKRTVIDVVFHLIVLRETHEIALLHGGQIIHGCRTYAHHSYNICMCVCVRERERERERERDSFSAVIYYSSTFSLSIFPFSENFYARTRYRRQNPSIHTHTRRQIHKRKSSLYSIIINNHVLILVRRRR